MDHADTASTLHGLPGRAQLQALLEQAPDGIFVADIEGRYTYVNQAGCRLLGCERADIIGRPIVEFIPAEDAARLAESKQRMLRGASHVGEWRLRRKDGTWVPVEVNANILADGQWQGFVRDISERKAHEAEREALARRVEEDHRLLRAIFEILPVGIWIADTSGRIVRNNPAGERVWRGARYVPLAQFGEYKGWWLDTGKPIAAEEWALARALTRGETSTGELVRIQCFDGSFKTIINSAAPLRDESGALAGAIVVNEDITALQEARERLRESEQRLRTVFELLPVGVYIIDRDGRIILANAAGQKIWQGAGYVGPERHGEYKGWWVESGKPIGPDEWAVARAIRDGETSRGELIRIQCFDGSFKTVLNWATPIRSESGEINGAVAVNEDVTSLQQTQEQLRAAVRDREEILAIVTHDLRNPLGGLLMAASAVERKARNLPGGESVRELAASLMDMSRRMSGMVEDLLAVAVDSTGGPSMLRVSRVEAARLLERAARAASPLFAKEGLVLDVRMDEVLPRIHVDADRMLRVFGNLLDNALKYTSAPGSITLSGERTIGGVRFTVANSGPPLPREELRQMFRPFWQAGRDRRGAGLGLSICRSIVEAHGGTIWAEPAEGQRVRICFVLPRQPAAEL